MEKNIYQIVSENIIHQIMTGSIPWRKPWCKPSGEDMLNYVSRKSYNGINRLLLTMPGEYMTFNQCKNAGGQIKKGEKAFTVFKWIPFIPKEFKAEKEKLEKEGLPTDHLTRFLAGYDKVFHISQTENVTSKIKQPEHNESLNPKGMADFRIEQYCTRERIKIVTKKTDICQLDLDSKTYNLPEKTQFKHEEDWYGKIFDGFIRNDILKEKPDVEDNVMNLAAEIGSSMLLNETGLSREWTDPNAAAACRMWVDEISKNPMLIVKACRLAETAARNVIEDFIS